jgi:hypothetical protein
MIGQTIAGIASFGGVMLVWTGFALALKRLRSWTRQQAEALRASGPIPSAGGGRPGETDPAARP